MKRIYISSYNGAIVAKRGLISARNRNNKNTSIHRCGWRLSHHFLFVLLLSLVYCQRTSIACRICDEENGAVLNRNAVIEPIKGYEFINNCGTLQDLLPIVIKSDDDICEELQNTLSSICGCPRELAGGVAPCSLCGNSNNSFNAGAAVSLQPSDVEGVAPGLARIVEEFPPTCQLLGAYLGSMPLESEECSVLMDERQTPALVQSQCACCGECNSELSGVTESTETKKSTCQVCPKKGDSYRVPDRDVTDIIDELGLNFLFAPSDDNNVPKIINNTTAITTAYQQTNTTITCSDLADPISGLDRDNAFCDKFLLRTFWGYCDCPFEDGPEELSCAEHLFPTYCDTPDSNFQPDLELPFLADVFLYGGLSDSGFPFENPTCQEVVWLMHGFPQDDSTCYAASQFAYVCGCGVRHYLGTETRSQQAWLAWLPRLTGLLSLIGSSCIVQDLFQKKKRPGRIRNHHHQNPDASSSSQRRSSLGGFIDGLNILQQIVLGMSVFDICSSIAIMFSTLPLPKYEIFNHVETEEGDAILPIPSGVYGAVGNEGTCKAQGFFIQLGLTSAFYNMALSIYYFLVIRHGIRESRLQKYRLWFHMPALLVGFSLAFAGIPFYDALYMICIVPPKVDYAKMLDINPTQTANGLAAFLPTETNAVVAFFTLIPISIVFAVGTCSLALVYLHVWKQDRAANRWRMSRGRNNALSSAVFWQFVFYTLSFLLSWPIYFAANFNAHENYDNYNFWVALVILFPLQGFWNATVYFRPRLVENIRKRQTVRKRKKEQLQREQQQQKRVALPKSSVPGKSSTGAGSTNESARTATERTEGISASIAGWLKSPRLPHQMELESSENNDSVQIGSSKFRLATNKKNNDTEPPKEVPLDLITESGVQNAVVETEREQQTIMEKDVSIKSTRSSNASKDKSRLLKSSGNQTKDDFTNVTATEYEEEKLKKSKPKRSNGEREAKKSKSKRSKKHKSEKSKGISKTSGESKDKNSKSKEKSKKARARKDTTTTDDVLPKYSSYELGKLRKYEHPSEEIIFHRGELSNASSCTDAV